MRRVYFLTFIKCKQCKDIHRHRQIALLMKSTNLPGGFVQISVLKYLLLCGFSYLQLLNEETHLSPFYLPMTSSF